MVPASDRSPVLGDYTAPGLMIPRLQGLTPPTVMDELCQALHQVEASLPDLRWTSRAALNRELLTALTLDHGAVFPQVQVPGLARPLFALGRSGQPLQWLVKFYPPIELVFLVLLPKPATAEAERVVETLNRLGRDPEQLNLLRQAPTAEQMWQHLCQVPVVGPPRAPKTRVGRPQA
jgi:mannitol/fructose-specific phosphotransferase system IIA component (Ntr-type)